MTLILIILSVSFVLCSIVLLNKNKELKEGKGYFLLGDEKTDLRLVGVYERYTSLLGRVSIQAMKQYTQRYAVYMENQLIKFFRYMAKRFYSFSNVITGHNIPKNKGSVSFFLKNIEEHKKTISSR